MFESTSVTLMIDFSPALCSLCAPWRSTPKILSVGISLASSGFPGQETKKLQPYSLYSSVTHILSRDIDPWLQQSLRCRPIPVQLHLSTLCPKHSSVAYFVLCVSCIGTNHSSLCHINYINSEEHMKLSRGPSEAPLLTWETSTEQLSPNRSLTQVLPGFIGLH